MTDGRSNWCPKGDCNRDIHHEGLCSDEAAPPVYYCHVPPGPHDDSCATGAIPFPMAAPPVYPCVCSPGSPCVYHDALAKAPPALDRHVARLGPQSDTEPKRPRDWIQTFTGKEMSTLDPDPALVCIEDIAHALSLKCRFAGHLRSFYSVALHSILGARNLPKAWALPFLLHEVSEVYLPDIASPLKPHVTVNLPGGRIVTWEDLEEIHARAVFKGLGLEPLLPALSSPQVKEMDLRMLVTEARALLPTEPKWLGRYKVEPLDLPAYSFAADPEFTEKEFLALYAELAK